MCLSNSVNINSFLSFWLGDPPARSTVLEQQEEKAHPLLQAIAEEVCCVDLKTQVALQRSE